MKVDVVIVGGGMVGLATALLLSQNGFEVCLLDIQPCTGPVLTEQYDLRVSAITLATVNLFKKLGIWETLQQLRVGKFEKIHIWEGQSTDAIVFEPARGYIIENKVIQLALLQKINESSRIHIIAPTVIHAIQKTSSHITVTVAGNNTIEAELLVGADGAHSKIREWAELGLRDKRYDQSALVATIHTEKSHDHIARQRFLTEGPLALLPLSQLNYCSIVWTNKPDTTKYLAECDPKEFNQKLNATWGNKLGEIRLVDQRLTFPLSKKHAEHYVTDRVALVGDAAHTIHPLAGQGVNLGFLDAHALANVLTQAKIEKRDIGLKRNLRHYERQRKSDNILVQKLMDIFNTPWLRGVGVKMVSHSNWLKNSLLLWMTQREKQ